MSPAEIVELRETQRKLAVQQEHLKDAQERLASDFVDQTKEIGQIRKSLEENTASTKRVEDTVNGVANNTKNLVDAFQTGVKVYRFFDWLRVFVKDWAWLPASAIAVIGYVKGWWSKLWP